MDGVGKREVGTCRHSCLHTPLHTLSHNTQYSKYSEPQSRGTPLPSLPPTIPASTPNEILIALAFGQVAGGCRAFKMEVRGLAVTRLLCRWIKTGKIDGLPRKGVKIGFQLLGDPLQQPSKMRAEREHMLANNEGLDGTGGASSAQRVDDALSGCVAEERRRYNLWDSTRRGGGCVDMEEGGLRGQVDSGKSAARILPDGIRITKTSIMRGCAGRGGATLHATAANTLSDNNNIVLANTKTVPNTLPKNKNTLPNDNHILPCSAHQHQHPLIQSHDHANTSGAQSSGVGIFGWAKAGVSAASGAAKANVTRTRILETAVSQLLNTREREAAGVREKERAVFDTPQDTWGCHHTDIKSHLAALAIGLGGG